MRWRKQKKILLDHPYFDSNKIVLNRKAAERIYDSGFPTFKEMIEGSKERFDMPLDAWRQFDEVIESRATEPRNKVGISFFATHKRLAVAMMVVFVIVSFFTLIPFGRALAADFFDMIMRIIDGRIEISSEYPDYEKYEYFNLVAEQYIEGDSEEVEENTPTFYPSFDEFVKQTGYTPVTINTDWLKCQTIQSYDNDVQGLTLRTLYYTFDKAQIVVTQQWGGADMVIEVQNAKYNKAIIFGDTELLYIIDPADGSFNGTAVLNDSILLIGSEKGVDTNKLLETLE